MGKEEILERLGNVHRANVIGSGLKSNLEDVVIKARKKSEEFSREALMQPIWATQKGEEPDQPLYSNADARDKALEEMDEEERNKTLGKAYNNYSQRSLADSVREIARGGDAFRDSDNSLLSLLGKEENAKVLIAETDEKDREGMALYMHLESSKKLKEKIETDKELDEKEREIAGKIGGIGLAKLTQEKLEKRGYKDELISTASEVATIVGSFDKKMQVAGINKQCEKIKERLAKRVGEDYKAKISARIANVIQKLTQSGDEKKELTGAALYFEAHKGYRLGEKSFKEEFAEDFK